MGLLVPLALDTVGSNTVDARHSQGLVLTEMHLHEGPTSALPVRTKPGATRSAVASVCAKFATFGSFGDAQPLEQAVDGNKNMLKMTTKATPSTKRARAVHETCED